MDSRHVSDGDWGIMPVDQRHQTDKSLRDGVRHVTYTVSGCGHVIRYQNTSNLEKHYIRGEPDHKELTDRLTGTTFGEAKEARI